MAPRFIKNYKKEEYNELLNKVYDLIFVWKISNTRQLYEKFPILDYMMIESILDKLHKELIITLIPVSEIDNLFFIDVIDYSLTITHLKR